MTRSKTYFGALVTASALALAACTPTEQGAAMGAVGGALVGSAVSGDGDRDKGAVIGGVLGAMAGAMIAESNQPGQCWYSDGRGGRYLDRC
jgi:outer membrane lipoprotein SlyB